MSGTTASLHRKISSAGDLQSVVRTMKAVAASSIGQYEESMRALAYYTRTVELGLSVCLREVGPLTLRMDETQATEVGSIGVIVFGSDQGLVGGFNERVAEFAVKTLAALPGKPQVWAVGERIHARLMDAGLPLPGRFDVPNSVQAIAPLIGQIQISIEAHRSQGAYEHVYVFYNRPKSGAVYEPVAHQLLPLDAQWYQRLINRRWPTGKLPEVMRGGGVDAAAEKALTLRALIREYLFIVMYQACAESLASENASRLAAMERADKNIDELLEDLQAKFHRLRQGAIDEELFDVVAGYEALSHGQRPPPA